MKVKTDLRINWLIAVVLTGWLFYLLAPVLTPFVAAALLAYLGDPLADRLQKLKLPRSLAVVAVFLLTFLVLALLVLLVGPLIRSQVAALFEALPDIARQVEQVWLPTVMQWVGAEAGENIGFGAFLANYSDLFGSWSGKILMSVSKSGGALAAAVLSLFLVPILTFYMLRDWDSLIAHLGALVPESQRETVFQLARETDDVLGAFLRGQILVMAALATLYTLGLSLVGVEYAVAIGVVAGLVSFVPYLGLVFGIALAGLTVALEPEPLWQLVGVAATFSIAQVIEGSILTPKLVGDRIGLHPVIVIFAVAAGGQLFGFFGILLALPAAAVLSVLVRFAYYRYLKENPEVLKIIEPESNQLVLPLRLADHAVFDSFLGLGNEILVATLAEIAEGRGHHGCWLWGAPATGKTHLLQATCDRAGDCSVYVPLAMFVRAGPAILDGLAGREIVCIDDVDAVAGDADWEAALFDLCNQIVDAGGQLVVSARSAPRECAFELEDLRSRLSRLPIFHLRSLDDEQRVAALQLRARHRGFELPGKTARYLLKRSKRDMASLFDVLDKLDLESLRAQRRLTIPFVRDALQL